MDTAKTVVVLGGGVGGLVAASALRKHLPRAHRVVLVDREREHLYAPSLLWLMVGLRKAVSIQRPLARLQRKGIQLRLGEVEKIVFLAFRRLAESRLAEIERITRLYLGSRDMLEGVDQATLLERVRSGAVLVLDVRPAQEYRSAHIPGALSVPLAELEQRLAKLPRGRQIVAYCRGPYCVMSVEAVEILRRHGRKAARLEIGVPEWRQRGLPVARGPDPAPSPNPVEVP